MKKVILKYKLSSREQFEDKLTELDFDLSPIYWQHDRVYVPRDYKPGMNFPRILMRTEMHAVDEAPKYALILRRHIEDSGVDIVEETPITDYVATVNIILQLGFKPAAEVSRRRQEVTMGDNTILYLDEIDGREEEHYAKIEEILSPDDSVEAVKTDLKKSLALLGETDIVNKPYAELNTAA